VKYVAKVRCPVIMSAIPIDTQEGNGMPTFKLRSSVSMALSQEKRFVQDVSEPAIKSAKLFKNS
jgi:hypothetical protein